MLLTLEIKLETNNVVSLTQLSSIAILLLERNFCYSRENLKFVIKKDNNNSNL